MYKFPELCCGHGQFAHGHVRNKDGTFPIREVEVEITNVLIFKQF